MVERIQILMGNSPNIRALDISGYDFKTIDLNTTIGREETPLVIFIVRGNYRTQFQILSDRGAKFNIVDFYGNSPLHYAAERKCDFIRHLMDKGLDPCLRNKHGLTPLHIAVNNKHYEYVYHLKNAMFVTDNNGDGPIHYAIKNGDIKMIHFLILNTPSLPMSWLLTYSEPKEYHLDYFANGSDITPLSLAIDTMNVHVIASLVDHGADPKAKHKGKSPNDHIAKIRRTLLYDNENKRCSKEDILNVWSVANNDTDVHRNINTYADKYTGLLSGTPKFY